MNKNISPVLSMRSPAKVNLFLEIIRKRNDGFHELESVFQTIPLYDTLEFTPGGDKFTLETTNPDIPVNSSNLILQAAELCREQYDLPQGGHFRLHKVIPCSGGLGGGSSNAATTLLLLNTAFNLNLTRAELARLGAGLGSDVAFFIYGGTCLCTGRGEIITPLPGVAPLPLHIIAPPWGVSTPAAFAGLDKTFFNRQNATGFIKILKTRPQDLPYLYAASFNHFEKSVCQLEPRQQKLHALLRQHNLMARMSGSGSSIWVLGESTHTLQRILPPDCRIIL